MNEASEREAFEAWCIKRWAGDRGALTQNQDGTYWNGHVDFSWNAWQARAAVPAHLVQQPTSLRAMLVKAREGLANGLWDYGPGQDEHEQCDALIAEIDAALAAAPQAMPALVEAAQEARTALSELIASGDRRVFADALAKLDAALGGVPEVPRG